MLSEGERRELDEIESWLSQEDPRLAKQLGQASAPRAHTATWIAVTCAPVVALLIFTDLAFVDAAMAVFVASTVVVIVAIVALLLA